MLTIVQCVNNLDLGGVEQLVLSLAGTMHARGFGSTICCIEDRGQLADQAEADGIPVHALNLAQNGKLAALRSFCTFLRQSRPVVIHSHNFKPFYYSALGTMLGAADGHIHSRHGSLLQHHRAVWRYRLLRPWVDSWVTVSADRQEELAQRTGLPTSQIHVVANGVDTTRFSPATNKGAVRRDLELPDDAPIIICVARLAPEKDLVTLLRAFKIVLNQWVGTDRRAVRSDATTHGTPGVRALPRLLLVGNGPCMEELRNEANRLGIADQVNFLGQRSDTHKFLQAADVFALSSLSEGQSVALIEALACGLPIVATDVGGNPEIVDSTCGILVPPQNPEALGSALIWILQDSSIREKFAFAARQRAVEHFSLDRMVDGYINLYQQAINRRAPLTSGC